MQVEQMPGDGGWMRSSGSGRRRGKAEGCLEGDEERKQAEVEVLVLAPGRCSPC
ncbi:GM23208 [Drosophila sechellia]|uniref:GM23208 n=1 Tax=Drosophila sechellia TaxID=7238 RepID=B4IIF3_DROSE|nr:GM23208 [Drosophila sechellia]